MSLPSRPIAAPVICPFVTGAASAFCARPPISAAEVGAVAPVEPAVGLVTVIAVEFDPVLARLTWSGLEAVPISVPVALRKFMCTARFAVSCARPCWRLVSGLLVGMFWKNPPCGANTELPGVIVASSSALAPEPEQFAHCTLRLFEVEAITLPEPSTICVFWLALVWFAAVAAPVGRGRADADTGCVTADPSTLRPLDVPGRAVIVPATLMPPSVALPGTADPVAPTDAFEPPPPEPPPPPAPVGRPEPPERFRVVAPAVSMPAR